MSNGDHGSVRTEAAEALQKQVLLLRRMLLLVALSCLAISLCLNLYAFTENRAIKRLNASQEPQVASYQELLQIMQRMVNEMQSLGGSNAAARFLLDRYREPLRRAGVATTAAGVEQP